MAIVEIARIQVRRGQELQTGIPQLEPGEFGWAQDTEHLYIGKRISEGAPDDDNTRILTENDLNYFELLLLNNTSTAASSYRYRDTLLDNTTVTSIQAKLDSLDPSLIDFGVEPSTGTYVQIDTELQGAISDIFNNIDPVVRSERRRILRIPAGWFSLANTVNLPPYTKLIGAGSGLTKIRYDNSVNTMFKTVDAAGNTFETGNMFLTTGSSRDIVIEGITFEFDSSSTNASSLITLDNTNHSIIKDCVFQKQFDPETTSTYGISDYGIGIQIRGQGDIGVEKCRDISIDRCEFNGLKIGIRATGTVVTPSIRNSIFRNLERGVEFYSQDALQGPTNGYIAYNRFEDVRKEGIYVGNNVNGLPSSTLSTQNYFSRVGGLYLSEFTSSTTITAVISYLSTGNKTVDDYFARRAYADSLTNYTGFYYNPFVRGSTTIADSAVYSLTVAGSTSTSFAKIPLNTSDQMISVSYQMYNNSQSRKGTILANLASDGTMGITDNYNYIENLVEDIGGITASTGSGVNVLVVTTSSYPRFADVQQTVGIWYLTGDAYPGKSAYITNVITSGSFYIVQTDSSAPTFNFWSGGNWTLLYSQSSDVSVYYNSQYTATNNFIMLTMRNSSTATFTLDYQIDIQT